MTKCLHSWAPQNTVYVRPLFQHWEMKLIYLIHETSTMCQAKREDRGTPSKQKTKTKPQKELNKTEIGNLPDKEFQVMVIKIIVLRRRKNILSENFNKEMGAGESIRTEEYNNWNEKHTGVHLQEIRGCRRTDQRVGRQGSRNHLNGRTPREKKK